MRYGLVQDNVIVKGPTGLPVSWENISGFNRMSDEEAAVYGWYVWEFVEIEVDAKTEVLENNSVTIEGTKIVERQVSRLKTAEELADDLKNKKQTYSKSTQTRLDDFAKTREYNDISSAATYANSNIDKFRIEGQYCVDIRDATWSKLYEIYAEVDAGVRELPDNFAVLELELPTLNWPI